MALAGRAMNFVVAGASALVASVYPTGAALIAARLPVLIAEVITTMQPVRAGNAELSPAGKIR